MGNVYKLGVQDAVELGDAVADKIDANGQLRLTSGTNLQTGTGTLVGGTLAVANTLITASSKVFISRKTQGAAPGHLSYTVSAGVSFTVTSSSGTDTGQFDWMIVNPIDADTDPSDYVEN